MCGIVGIAGGGWTESQLRAMVSIQHHRGPNDEGLYSNDQKRIGIGHSRLSILDLSSSGQQPMSNRDGTIWLTFNGEIYNYIELRRQLREYCYQTETDTEVILAAYERWGEDCVEHFIGMFAFAIWDNRENKLVCARDRLGIKPFHYAIAEDSFYFSSEIKAILSAGIAPDPDMDTWGTYLKYGYYDHSESTFFRHVKALPPGHLLVWKGGSVSMRSFWDLPASICEGHGISDKEGMLRLVEVLDDSVRLRLRSDVPLGLNVSGGLDSASLMITMEKYLDHDSVINTFTAAFGDSKYDEVKFADAVPRTKNWNNHVVYLCEEEVHAMMNEVMWHQEAPIGGIATIGYHKLHQAAKDENVTVLLEGQGVDELLAGYRYYRPYYLLDLLASQNHEIFERELRACGSDPKVLIGQIRALRKGKQNLVYQDGSQFLMRQCLANDFSERVPLPPEFPKPFKSHLRNALYRDLRFTKLPRVLRMNDRLSMAHSRELREPYLDHRFVELAFNLDGGQKIRNGESKYLLRQAMSGMLPDAVRLAEKRPVVTPQREWIRTSLKPLVEEVIHSRSFSERGLFDLEAVKRSFSEFCKGQGDNSFFIWQWMNTEYWFRTFCDQTSTNKTDSKARLYH